MVSTLERFLDWFYAAIGWPVLTAEDKARTENAALKAIKRTRALEAENAELRRELGLQ